MKGEEEGGPEALILIPAIAEEQAEDEYRLLSMIEYKILTQEYSVTNSLVRTLIYDSSVLVDSDESFSVK